MDGVLILSPLDPDNSIEPRPNTFWRLCMVPVISIQAIKSHRVIYKLQETVVAMPPSKRVFILLNVLLMKEGANILIIAAFNQIVEVELYAQEYFIRFRGNWENVI